MALVKSTPPSREEFAVKASLIRLMSVPNFKLCFPLVMYRSSPRLTMFWTVNRGAAEGGPICDNPWI